MSNLELSVIERSIKKNNKKIEFKLNQDHKFIQSVNKKIFDKLTEKKQIDEVDTNIISLDIKPINKYYFSTNPGKVSNLPDFLNDLFQSADYYTLGMRKKNQFLESILFIIDKNYKLLSESEQDIYIEKIQESLLNNIENYYNKFNYKEKKINRYYNI